MNTKILLAYAVSLAGLFALTNPAHAELSLQQDRLTLHVQAVPLEDVLVNLSQEGAFRITILDNQMTDKITVTQHFDGVPSEDGLSRLLAHWNYGLTKQQPSGQIQEVFLVSKRVDPKDLPTPTPAATPTRDSASRQNWDEDAESLAAFTEESSDEDYLEDHATEEFEEEGFEGDQETFTEEMIPGDLPPEIREEMLEDLARMSEQ